MYTVEVYGKEYSFCENYRKKKLFHCSAKCACITGGTRDGKKLCLILPAQDGLFLSCKKTTLSGETSKTKTVRHFFRMIRQPRGFR
ncbi:unnamed protein product [Amoebophrya sp. A120]|nr:unnamed protein product [Amoebophrya sp. A120]|eukprot:GSA120T00026082001.1